MDTTAHQAGSGEATWDENHDLLLRAIASQLQQAKLARRAAKAKRDADIAAAQPGADHG